MKLSLPSSVPSMVSPVCGLTRRKSACYGNQSEMLFSISRQASHCSLIEVDFVFC